MTPDPAYSDEVRRLFGTTPGAGAPEDPVGWRCGEAREPLTGTHVRVWLRVESGRIAEARYAVRGCPHTVAVAAAYAAALAGRPVVAHGVEIATFVTTLDVPAAKLGRLFAIEDAVRAAALQSGAPVA
jgi:hypothetical protein